VPRGGGQTGSGEQQRTPTPVGAAQSTREESAMSESLVDRKQVKDLLAKASGLDTPGGNERVKKIVHRVMTDMCRTIEDLDVTQTEFWTAMGYLTDLGKTNEWGLLVPGLGIEHFLDLLLDEKERKAGITGGTPRTIEGPLYVAGAPVVNYEARLDDGTEKGEVVFMEGQVKDTTGKPISGATVEVWHANTQGFYSHCNGPPQSPFNLRRTIKADAQGRYRFRSILPSGYGCPPDGTTQKLLDLLSRHGQRPAHIHFFVSAPGYRQLTTQINLAGDKYVYDDFAFGTRDGLVVEAVRQGDPKKIKERGVDGPFSEIRFDFTLNKEVKGAPNTIVERAHFQAT
jgi:catechol 1,2-dioxygenase